MSIGELVVAKLFWLHQLAETAGSKAERVKFLESMNDILSDNREALLPYFLALKVAQEADL